MKKIIILSLLAWICVFTTYSCKKIYDNVETFGGERVYPAKFDTISGKIGFERVELNLMKVGRVPSGQIYLGKASKTIVEYDKERIVIDSVVSWVNVPNLTVSKLYRFKVYSEDQYGNRSVPQEIALIPYTKNELTTIAVQSPRIFASPSTAVLDWADKISSILLSYCDLEYSYVDQGGEIRKGKRDINPRIFTANLKSGDEVKVDVNYRVVPKVNGVEILDTVVLNQRINFYMPSPTTAFLPAEVDILKKNGISVFNAQGVANVKKLTFPIHTKTLQDLFYFSNLDEIDLTGGNLFEMTTTSYNRNSVVATVGGGPFLTSVRRLGNMTDANARFLVDLLENDLVKKVKYIPYSLGIDHLLQPFVASGKVELVDTGVDSDLPSAFFMSGGLEHAYLRINLTRDPTDAPAGTDLRNVLKVALVDRSASLLYMIPTDYQFNADLYPYLRFKVYAPDKSHFQGAYDPFRTIWPRFMNRGFNFNGDSPYGQGLWNTDKTANKLSDEQLGKWVDMKISLSEMKGKNNRVILINIGGEPGFAYSPPKQIVYYFANFRLSKN